MWVCMRVLAVRLHVRVCVCVPNDLVELRERARGLLLAVSHNIQRSNALPIQAHVLCVWLCHKHRMALREEVTERERVVIWVAARKALIGTIEETQQALVLC